MNKEEINKKIIFSQKCRNDNTPEMLLDNIPKIYVERAKYHFPDLYLYDATIFIMRLEGFSLIKIGELIDRSRERVRQIEHKTMRKLIFQAKHNKNYFDSLKAIYPKYFEKML